MEPKKYASYAEIDRDLEILKLEKEIHYHKLMHNVNETKDSLAPENIMGGVPKIALDLLGSLSGPLKSVALSFLLKKIFK